MSTTENCEPAEECAGTTNRKTGKINSNRVRLKCPLFHASYFYF